MAALGGRGGSGARARCMYYLTAHGHEVLSVVRRLMNELTGEVGTQAQD